MAVYKRSGEKSKSKSSYYYYDFRWNGRRFSGCTYETSKSKAERVEQRVRERVKTPQDDTTIDGAFLRWWEEKGEQQSESSTIMWRLSLLQDNLEELLSQDRLPLHLSAVTTNHLAKYVRVRTRQPNRRNKLPSPATINREIQLLRSVMRYAVNVWGKQIALPSFGAVLQEEPEERIVEISQSEMTLLKQNMRGDYHDVLDFLVLAGNRAGNVLVNQSRLLKPQDVDFENFEVTFYIKSKKSGGRRLVLPLTEPMIVLLANNIGNHPDAVFTYIAQRTRGEKVRGKRYPITHTAFRSEFKRAAAAIGRPELRVHDLRHTAATRTLRATGDLRLAQIQLGHTRITTTEKYAHTMKSDLLAGLQKSHGNPTEQQSNIDNLLKEMRKRKRNNRS